MKTILVTGSKGLIGRKLVALLIESGYKVNEFDVAYEPTAPNYGDINNLEMLREASEGCQGIIHLAAVSRVIWGERQPDLCVQTNVVGTENVIQAACESKTHPWILYASSREVYGEAKKFPVKETHKLAPVNVYGRTKALAEKLVLNAREQNINTAILRFSNVFGCPYDHPDRVVPAFTSGALLGHTLKIEGGENVFDFTYLDDVVWGIRSMVNKLNQDSQSIDPIHFTGNQGTSLNQLVELISEALGTEIKTEEKAPRNYDVSYFIGDNSRAKEVLGWEPKTSLEQAISYYLGDLSKILKSSELCLAAH